MQNTVKQVLFVAINFCMEISQPVIFADFRNGGCQLLAFLLFLSLGVPLPLGAWERPHYFIVALPGPSIYIFSFFLFFLYICKYKVSSMYSWTLLR